MNITLVYATNSGTTQTVAQMIADGLTQAAHTVTLKQVNETTPEDMSAAGAIIFGSPSWDFDGKEGQPHEDYPPFMEKMKGQVFENKPFAVFGLGDSSYKYFCGAVDHLEEFVKSMKGNLVTASLRIDNYYQDANGNNEKVNAWTEELKKKFTA